MGLINDGKSIYEVARLSGNRILFLDDHLDRLSLSLKLEGTEPWLSRKEMGSQLEMLLNANLKAAGNVKFVMNFHPGERRHFLAYFVEHRYPTETEYRNGVKVITFPFERMDPNKKIWRPDFRTEVEEAIRENQAFEALLINPSGYLMEASKANVFAIRDRELITPPDEFVLPGITRRYVLRACQQKDIPVAMRNIHRDELKGMDGLFLTGTSLHILPVCQVDELRLPPGNGILKKIMQEFQMILQNQLK